MLGDVILVTGDTKFSSLIRGVQYLRTGSSAVSDHTHVALRMGTYMVIHALAPLDHVILTWLQGLMAPNDRTSVWRHKELSERLTTDATFRYAFQ